MNEPCSNPAPLHPHTAGYVDPKFTGKDELFFRYYLENSWDTQNSAQGLLLSTGL